MRMLLLVALFFAQRPTASLPIQTGTVTGRLLNEDGSPAVKIRVSAMAIPDSKNANDPPALITLTESDSTGRYRLADVPVGRYYIVAGFVDSPTYYPRGTVPAAATPVNVTARAVTANIDFKIERPSTGLNVSGRVIVEGSPTGGTLQVMLNGGPSGSFTNLNVPIKLDGSFEFVRVRPGTYSLMVNPTQFFQPRTVVVSEKDVTGLELRVPWTGEVNGRVVVEGGDPVPTIQLSFTGESRVTSAYPNNQALRAILTEGFFGVTAQGIPPGFYVKSITSGTTNLLSEPLKVNRTSMPPEIVVTLGVSTPSPWVKLSGRITGSLPSGMRSVTLSGPIGSIQAGIAIDGSFEFPKLLPGTYSTFSGSAFSTQPLTIVVPNRDLAGVELAFPATRDVSGRIIVEDGGPLPRPILMMNPAVEEKATPINSATSTPTLAQVLVISQNNQRSGPLPLNLNIQPDGTFKAALPLGQYEITLSFPSNGGPSPFSTKTFTYGSTDLLKDPLKVTASDSAEMRLTVAAAPGTSSARVSGRVVGLTPSVGAAPTSVTMYNPVLFSGLTTTVRPDGTFEFPKVYTGTYQLRLAGGVANAAAIPAVDVNVGSTDVTNIEIVVPRQKEISGRVVLEGRGVMPQLNIPLTTVSASGGFSPTTFANINPRPDGTFKTTIPEGERQVGHPTGLPPGYTLKSFSYGSTELISNPLKISATDTAEFRLVISTPDLPPVKVSGKVANADSARGPVSVTISAAGYNVNLQATATADGSFEFPAVFPGTYTVSAAGGNVAIRSTTATVAVTDRDVTGVEIILPQQKEISGRITLEGRGPMPAFSLQMNSVAPASPSPSPFATYMSINPQPDGTFRVTVPEGERRIGVPTNLPSGYTLKAITYGSTDLLTAPMKVDRSDTADLHMTLAVPNQTPVKVSGKVSGFDPAQLNRAPLNVIMTGLGYAGNLQATVAPDGSFEFPEVFPGNYSARINTPIASSVTSIVVVSTDVRNVEIILPAQKEITGRVVVEGSAPIPRSLLRLSLPSQRGAASGPIAGQFFNINPGPDGTFRLTLPEGERFLSEVTNLPPGYKLKAVTYGSTDVLTSPLKIAKADTSQLVITLYTEDRKPVAVSGRVDGVDPKILEQGGARTTLTSTEFASTLNVTIRSDGSFTFPSVFPGNYNAQVVIQGQLPASPPTRIAVKADGTNDLHLVVPKQLSISGRIVIDGGGPFPRVPLSFASVTPQNALASSTTVTALNPDSDGMIRITLPAGNLSLRIPAIPPGYVLKSITYGGKDVRQTALSLVATDPPEELRITLEKTTPTPWVRVSGRVVGLATPARDIRVSVNGSFTPTQTTVANEDGTFSFSAVFQGPNTFQVSGTNWITTVTVGPKDVTDLEIRPR